VKRYEYEEKKIVKDIKKVMCEMGKDGWRLVTVENQIFYFIRDAKEGE
jgi:uncharacterized protein (UPF0335 family)